MTKQASITKDCFSIYKDVDDISALADEFAGGTIETVLVKDDVELGLDLSRKRGAYDGENKTDRG